MALGQDLLNLMEVIDNETQLQAGEADVVRGLIALNAAQDYFESLVAAIPGLLGDTIGTVTTTASTEATAFPTGVLRIDRLQMINASNSLPEYDLWPIKRTGGHRQSRYWPLNLISSSGSGKPFGYWTNGRNIYWDPLPNATHTVRWYGFSPAAAITAAGTFAYPDICQLPFASFAVKLQGMGVGDATAELSSLAAATFQPVITALTNFNRDGGTPLEYTRSHNT